MTPSRTGCGVPGGGCTTWAHSISPGGTVVHISSGAGALVAAIVLGKRKGLGKEAMDPHDMTMVVLGAALLWFGWFGFNAGSALTSGGLAAQAFVNTNTAAAMAALTWMTVSWAVHRRPSVLGAAAGAVAGLVAITRRPALSPYPRRSSSVWARAGSASSACSSSNSALM